LYTNSKIENPKEIITEFKTAVQQHQSLSEEDQDSRQAYNKTEETSV
jgi:hypothetical protein